MPRLGSFLVCEKLVIDQQNKPTIISVFQSIAALVPEGQQMPNDTIGANPWAIFCEWFFSSDDDFSKKFEEVIEVLMPDGSPSPIRGRLAFNEIVKSGQGTRAYVNMFGMPISQTGFLRVNVWLEADSVRVTDVSSYLIKIEHSKQPPMPNDGGTLVPTLTQTKPS